MVTSSRYNPEDQKIDVDFWVPVRLGEMVPYTAAWDDGINQIDIFPTYRDIAAGSAGGVSGGEKRTLPPSNGTILDIQLNQRGNFTQGDPTPHGPYSVNADGLPVIPADLGYLPPLPGGDPGIDTYHYPERGSTFSEPHREWSAAYPGTLVGYQTTLDNGRQVYNVDVYRNGVNKPAVTTSCQCMQLDIRDRIPAGVSCIVMENVYRVKNEDTGNYSFPTERTFVIPIWLR
jgi:hypothetical protein